jgi:hypothetical protein
MSNKSYYSSKPFIILAPARSGSTLLKVLLEQNPEITCYGEIFGKKLRFPQHKTDLIKLDLLRRNDLKEFINFIFSSSDKEHVGFKLLYEQSFQSDRFHLLDTLIEADVQVINLWRSDLSKIFISRLNHVNFTKEVLRPTKGEFVQFCKSIISCNQMISGKISGLKLIPVEYEKLLVHPIDVLNGIFNFLDLSPFDVILPSDKLNANENYVVNGDEVTEWWNEIKNDYLIFPL